MHLSVYLCYMCTFGPCQQCDSNHCVLSDIISFTCFGGLQVPPVLMENMARI